MLRSLKFILFKKIKYKSNPLLEWKGFALFTAGFLVLIWESSIADKCTDFECFIMLDFLPFLSKNSLDTASNLELWPWLHLKMSIIALR